MKSITGILIFISLLFWSFSKEDRPRIEDDVVRYEFALSLINGPNSQMVTFAIVAIRDTVVVKTQFLTKDQFLSQITGRQKSIANPLDTNMMELNNIPDCLPIYDSLTRKYYGYYCPIIDELWKVRFKRNPFSANSRQDNGYAHYYYGPSQPQLNFLNRRYKVKNISDLFIGERMFEFLRDVEDTSWIRQYKEAI